MPSGAAAAAGDGLALSAASATGESAVGTSASSAARIRTHREIVVYSVTVRSMPLYHCLDMAVRAPFSCICCTA
jgi:hypothetical protein